MGRLTFLRMSFRLATELALTTLAALVFIRQLPYVCDDLCFNIEIQLLLSFCDSWVVGLGVA